MGGISEFYARISIRASRHLCTLLLAAAFSAVVFASASFASNPYEEVSFEAGPNIERLPEIAPKRETPLMAAHPSSPCPQARYLQVLPQGLIYKSYLAGVKEPRLASKWVYEKDFGWMWDVNLGGRVGILRYGTNDPLDPQGWQIDVEGAAQPRLSLEHERDVVACDYRAGVPLTYANGPHHYKLAYYHLSAHLGDEWMQRFPGIRRINYSRDVFTFGYSNYWTPDLRLYGEVGYAFYRGDYTKPWEFQFGMEYSPLMPRGIRPAPFFAINGYLREDNDYSGNLTVETGLQWRGPTGNLFRLGMIYFNGMSDQYEFFDSFENKIGMGIWYDF